MKREMLTAQAHLVELLEEHELTAGMYVRVYGDHLIVGRQVSGEGEPSGLDDRVRFTRITDRMYGLSIKRHTGRWERTPFSGTMDEMVETVREFMQHVIAAW